MKYLEAYRSSRYTLIKDLVHILDKNSIKHSISLKIKCSQEEIKAHSEICEIVESLCRKEVKQHV